MEKEEIIAEVEGKDTKVYEVGYILVSTISEENIFGESDRIKGEIKKLGGSFISEENPKFFDIAYTMCRTIANKKTRFSTGYFGWVKFELLAEDILKLKDVLSRDEKIIRFLITRTVKENTMSPKKVFVKNDSYKKKTYTKEEKVEGPAPEINKEEIDKKIDELIEE
ncbi:MAG: 30S ribosomal protein S6 [Candidatus Paceibacterota bacterium]|jgi:ribosomal protein S6